MQARQQALALANEPGAGGKVRTTYNQLGREGEGERERERE